MVYLNDDIGGFDLQAALPLLSEQRRQQMMRYRHELGRKQCAIAYLLLREGLLAEYGITDMPLFEYGDNGKPLIAGLPHIHFNISHCREAVVCAVADMPVGIDVESIREYKETLARYTMNEEEMARILDSDSPALTFTRLWTQKEALLKMTGEGIGGRSMRQVLAGSHPPIDTTESSDKRYVYSICKQQETTKYKSKSL